MSGATKLSVVIPVYNEEAVLPILLGRLDAVLDLLMVSSTEVLLISDGSTDGTNSIIRAKVATDERYRGIIFARNFGHQAAVSVGLEHCCGDYVSIIDGDLQDPPEVIGELLSVVMGGADVAYAVRRHRKEGLLKRSLYAGFYRTLHLMADIAIPLDSGDFCCMRRRVVDAMLLLPERNRFVRGIRAWVGYKQVALYYDRNARAAGSTHYTLKKLLRLASDGLFGFSSLPIIIMQILGFIISFVAALVAMGYALWFILDPKSFPAGFATLVVSVWFLGGVQLLFMGFVGEYLFRAFDESRRRPIAIIADILKNPGS